MPSAVRVLTKKVEYVLLLVLLLSKERSEERRKDGRTANARLEHSFELLRTNGGTSSRERVTQQCVAIADSTFVKKERGSGSTDDGNGRTDGFCG